MFFRPDLESTLQPMNSSSRKRLSRRRREVSGHVEDQAKSPTGLGHEATPHGWRSAQSTSARRRRAGLCSRFPFWVFKVHVGRILLSHVCFCFAPRTTQNLLGYPMIPPPQFPVFSSRCLFHSTLQTDSLRHAERRINSLQSITPVQFDKMFIGLNRFAVFM